ncbi:HNH endonuclease family protein [Streptomyces sp. NPDC051954]|uniref:HNH endonuclease family protein n=1 Tax=Streptomyces sp. NPDC051954 TaxID=3155524 RepID=UPI0034456918
MIKNLMRAAMAAALTVLPLTAPAPAHASETLSLAEAVNSLPLAAESRDGYQRTSFKHWNAGKNPTDGCNTRMEVLLSEAVDAPQVLPGCKLSGGRWWSYYDAKWVTSAGALDVDHMVPLAEAWDSGASQWTAARREAYANDLAAERSLVAVTAGSNRSKADQDPAQWLPNTEVTCRYLSEWTATKKRWELTADAEEWAALAQLAEACPTTTVVYEPVP